MSANVAKRRMPRGVTAASISLPFSCIAAQAWRSLRSSRSALAGASTGFAKATVRRIHSNSESVSRPVSKWPLTVSGFTFHNTVNAPSAPCISTVPKRSHGNNLGTP